MKYGTLYIVGPTASGKTALSIEIAQKLGGEIICADSQTLRRGMDIGTAKPSIRERKGIPHYMLDVIDPYETYSLARFLESARSALYDIHSRGKLAIVVGGTGLYVDALFYNFSLPELKNKDDFSGMSVEDLQKAISSRKLAMPQNKENPRHLVNVLKRSGNMGVRQLQDPRSLIVGIYPGREVVVNRINERVEAMFNGGFVQEVEQLIKTYGEPPREMDAIGYRIVYRYLKGEIALEEAKELFRIGDRQYAKRQMAWFKRSTAIQWFASPGEARDYILERAWS